VEVSQYLADLRLEEAAAKSANMHVSKPGQYKFIKESLDVEEAKYNEVGLTKRTMLFLPHIALQQSHSATIMTGEPQGPRKGV